MYEELVPHIKVKSLDRGFETRMLCPSTEYARLSAKGCASRGLTKSCLTEDGQRRTRQHGLGFINQQRGSFTGLAQAEAAIDADLTWNFDGNMFADRVLDAEWPGPLTGRDGRGSAPCLEFGS